MNQKVTSNEQKVTDNEQKVQPFFKTTIVIRSVKMSGNTGRIVTVQGIHQNSKKWLLSVKNFLCEKNIEVVLTTFCCYDYDANASETVEKVAIDQVDYHKCFLYVIVCCLAKVYQ